MRLLCRGQWGWGPPPARFRPGDAAFQYGTPAQLLWSFSWKLLAITSPEDVSGAGELPQAPGLLNSLPCPRRKSVRTPIRLPQLMRDAQLPGHEGEDLVSCLYTLREADGDRFESIEAALRAGFPGFERLNFPPVAAGTLAMTWKDKTSKNPFFMHQLSEGTLRFLWLATLLQSPGLTAVTMIDEPEVCLHPELLSLLADLLREASQRTQLIVATHADRLVRFLKPSEVVMMNVSDEGVVEATRADELDLEQWLEDYTLDEVWRMGRMGARS